VRVTVQPGYDPHTYDPTPQQIGALATAALYVRTGVPFENAWMDRIRSANREMQILDARTGLGFDDTIAHDHTDHAEPETRQERHSQGHNLPHAENRLEHEADPHVWTSPLLAKHMISNIRNKLSELDPTHSVDYARNHSAFSEELDALDRDIRAQLDPLQNRKFMVFHPAWGYFASTYNLTQVPIERQGKEPGARALAALIEQARAERIRVVFVQPQFDKRLARRVAEEIGGGVIAVDPLAPNYVDNLRQVAQQFARAMQP